MPYAATVLRVMIASPSDVPEARDAVEKAVHGWNDANARNRGVILQPWRWETSAVPVMGAHPQQLINAQGVDDSDIVFALFGGRLGSPTPSAISGTIEEVDRALAQGKPVHMYFSTGQRPHDVDTMQLDALRAFKQEVQGRGLLGEFSNAEQLRHEAWKAIVYDIDNLGVGSSVRMGPGLTGVDFLVQPGEESQVSGHTTKGAPKYKTKRWLDVLNQGSSDAENVTYEAIHDGLMILLGSKGPTTIHKGQSRRLPVQYAAGGSDGARLRIRWTEGGEDKVQDFRVG